jgi:hypothetical protein
MSAQSLFTNKTTGNIGLRSTLYSESVPETLTGTDSESVATVLQITLTQGLYMMECSLPYELTDASTASRLRCELYVNNLENETKISDNFAYITSNGSNTLYGTIDSVVYVPAGESYKIQVNLNAGSFTGSITFDYDSSPAFAVVTKVG